MASTIYPAERGDFDSSETPAKDKDLIKRITDRFDYMVRVWKDVRDQAELDDRALSISGPWTDDDKNARTTDRRPCIHLDQISQYIHGLVNEVRNNALALQVDPAGEGSNENTAQLRADRIRQIEYSTNGLQTYHTAFESAAKRSWGVAGIKIEYESWKSRKKVMKLRRFANAYSVLWDPDTLEADCSDMQDAFVLSRMPKDEFKRKYPKARATSMGTDAMQMSPAWIDDNSIQVAEYWYVDKVKRHIIFCDTPEGEKSFFKDELEKGVEVKGKALVFLDGSSFMVIEERDVEEPKVKMALTNGIEVLEDVTDWPGKWIPIGICLGEEDFVKSGSKVKRIINSYIRKARDGQMLFDYYKSNEAEVIGMAPKIPWIIYEGQDEGHEEEWATAHKVPRSVLHVKATNEEVPNTLLPLPRFNGYEPPVQALEIGAESARRSIQASVSSYGVTRLDDTNVKSGIALKQLESQNQLGSFHFVDNYKVFIRHMGRMMNDLLDDVEGTGARNVGMRSIEGNYKVQPINQEVDGQMQAYSLNDESQHEVTISTGPSYQSQRQEAQTIIEALVQNMQNLPLDPQKKAALLALLIKMKGLGPLGDKAVEIIDPSPKGPTPDPQQLMAEVQQWSQLAEQLGQKIQMLEQEKHSKAMDIASREKIAAMDAQLKKLEIMVNAQQADAKMRMEADQAEKDRQLEAAETHAELQSKEATTAFQAEQAMAQAKINSVAKQETKKKSE